MSDHIFPFTLSAAPTLAQFTSHSAPHANVRLCLCLCKRPGTMFSGMAIMSWRWKRALKDKMNGETGLRWEASGGWHSSNNRVMGPTKAVLDTQNVWVEAEETPSWCVMILEKCDDSVICVWNQVLVKLYCKQCNFIDFFAAVAPTLFSRGCRF